MKLLITGDLVVNQAYNSFEKIDHSLIDLFAQSNINIVNLEAPVTESTNKIRKTGSNIKSHREGTINVLKVLRVNIATLANNHVLDYDEQGVADTMKFCKEHGLETVGAGIILQEASQTLFISIKEGKIAIVNFAENEWASATGTSAGANLMNIIDNTAQIKDARSKADYVIVIIHGGHEYYNLPSPRMQKQYRFYAEQGADIVVGHHTHCINGHETWNRVPIYYSLGNFLFTHDSSQPDWYKGLILEIELSKENIKTKLHPISQAQGDFKLSLLQGKEKQEIENRVKNYSSIIGDIKLVKMEWEKYVATMSKSYINLWSPFSFVGNRYLSAIIRRLPVKLINKKGLALYLNIMRCEAHRDLSMCVLNKKLKIKKQTIINQSGRVFN